MCIMGNGPIIWETKKQNCIALSTVEAEYVSASLAAQELLWLNTLCKELKLDRMTSVLHMDNQGAIAIAKNPTNHSKTKHIDIRYHFIRECLSRQRFQVTYCETKKMLADLLTKPLDKTPLTRLVELIGLSSKWVNSKVGEVLTAFNSVLSSAKQNSGSRS